MLPKLFILQFAGGNSYSFRFMNRFLNEFEVIVPELPGRGNRMEEMLLTDFRLAAEDIYRQIEAQIEPHKEFLIYGHSLGAYIGLRVTSMLEKKDKAPKYLIVSGNPGPGARLNKHYHRLPSNEFRIAIEVMGGLPSEITENKEVFDFFEPIIRADFELAEKEPFDNEASVSVPIYALMGSQEELVDKISNWQNYTTLKFSFEIFEGNHFFIHKHTEKIAEIISRCFKGEVE